MKVQTLCRALVSIFHASRGWLETTLAGAGYRILMADGPIQQIRAVSGSDSFRDRLPTSAPLESIAMKTLAAIQKQIAELRKKAEAIEMAARKEAIGKARALIEQHGLTAEDLGLSGGRRKAAGKAAKPVAGAGKGEAKYRDPATGKTWTGVGRAPAWIAGAKDRSKFLIAAAPGADSAAAAPKPKAAARKNAGARKTAEGGSMARRPAKSAKAPASKKAGRAAARTAAGATESGSATSEQAGETAQG